MEILKHNEYIFGYYNIYRLAAHSHTTHVI